MRETDASPTTQAPTPNGQSAIDAAIDEMERAKAAAPLPLTEDERDVLDACQDGIDAAQREAQLIFNQIAAPHQDRRRRAERRIEKRLDLPVLALQRTHRLSDDGAAVVPRESAED